MKSVIIKALMKLGLMILFINSLKDTYIWLENEQSKELAGGFVFGLFYAAIFFIAFYGIGFAYDEIKGWVYEYRMKKKNTNAV